MKCPLFKNMVYIGKFVHEHYIDIIITVTS